MRARHGHAFPIWHAPYAASCPLPYAAAHAPLTSVQHAARCPLSALRRLTTLHWASAPTHVWHQPSMRSITRRHSHAATVPRQYAQHRQADMHPNGHARLAPWLACTTQTCQQLERDGRIIPAVPAHHHSSPYKSTHLELLTAPPRPAHGERTRRAKMRARAHETHAYAHMAAHAHTLLPSAMRTHTDNSRQPPSREELQGGRASPSTPAASQVVPRPALGREHSHSASTLTRGVLSREEKLSRPCGPSRLEDRDPVLGVGGRVGAQHPRVGGG